MSTTLGIKALSIAEKEIGNRPCPTDPSPTCRTWGPAMEKYLGSVGITRKGGGYDYCAAFVNWCFKEAAAALQRSSPLDKKSGDSHIARTPAGVYRFARGQGHLVKTPDKGDIFVTQDFSHAGLVAEVKGELMDTVEGNTWVGDRQWGVWKRQRKSVAGNYFIRLS